MGYYLQAILCKQPLVGAIFDNFTNTKRVRLDVDLYLIPYTSDLFDEFNQYHASESLEKFELLNEKLFEYLLAKSVFGPIAYIEAEYFGGVGGQSAIMFMNGHVHHDTRSTDDGYGAINTVLREFGVQRNAEFDEWDTVGMLRHRNTDDWLEDSE
jgi:hypothetical protein